MPNASYGQMVITRGNRMTYSASNLFGNVINAPQNHRFVFDRTFVVNDRKRVDYFVERRKVLV
jgi:hypothetical protein